MTISTPAASSSADRVATWEPPGPGSWVADRSHGDGNHTPWFRGIVSTLTAPAYADVLAELGAALGALDVQFVNGTMYRRAVPLIGARFDKGTPPPNAAAWLVCRLHPKFREREKTALRTIEAKPFRKVIADWHDHERDEWEEKNRALQSADPRGLSDGDLTAHLRTLDAHCRAGWQRHHTLHAYDLGPIGDLLQHVIDWGIEPVAAMSLLRGSSPATTEAAAHGRAIADALRGGGVDPADVRDLDTVQSVPAAAAALDAYLDVFGWRLISSYDLDGKTLHELPAAICAIIRAGAEGTEPLGVDTSSEASVRSMAGDPELFDELLADARAAYGVRDDNGPLTWEWPAGLMRRAYLAAGERLHVRGQLVEPDHVINLDIAELASLLEGRTGPDAAQVAARDDYREWEGTLEGPDHLGAPPILTPDLSPLTPGIRRLMGIVLVALALLEPDTEVARERLVGTGIGEGTYRGIARVAHDAAVAVESMEPGDVLVAPWTAPSYNAVLSIAGGIVVQEGGVLCHAAVMARELAVPAVVGCTDAMAEINSGDLVEIDPTAGRVTVIERAATV